MSRTWSSKGPGVWGSLIWSNFLICRSRVANFTCGYIREVLQHYYTGLLHKWSSCIRVLFSHDACLPRNTRFPRPPPRNFRTKTPPPPKKKNFISVGYDIFWPLCVISFVLMLQFDIACSCILRQLKTHQFDLATKTFVVINTFKISSNTKHDKFEI